MLRAVFSSTPRAASGEPSAAGAGGLVVALQNLSMYALLFQLPFLFEGSMNLDPARGGRVLLVMMAAMVVAAPLGGRISERIGVRATVLLGLALAAVATPLLDDRWLAALS